MLKAKRYIGIIVLSVLALLLGSCTGESPLAIENATDARDAALAYLRESEDENAPSAGIVWQEEDVTPSGWVGAVFKEFTSDEWMIKVSYPVVLLENTIYEVTLTSINLGWHWKGSIKADGSVTELSAFQQMSAEESQRIAEEFVRNSPTFIYDGMEGTLILTDTLTLRCPYCWVFSFEFDSGHAGYGDRTGQVLAEVITRHRAVIGVEQLEITSAVMDDKWDMIRQTIVSEEEELEGALSVAELLENPMYDAEVTIYGNVSLLGQLNCPCFELTSGGATIQVWYNLMVENDGIQRAPVNVQGINNGDKIMVTGELKGEGGVHYYKGDFWASAVIVLSPSQTDALENITWVLQSYGEQGNLQTVLQGTEITAVFDGTEGQVHGSAGCNNYFGSYQSINNKLSIQEIAYTEMYCLDPEGVMEQEEQYLKAIQAAESFQIQDGKLQINSGDQILVYTAE